MERRMRPDTGATSPESPKWLRLKAAEFVRLTAETGDPATRGELERLAAAYLARARQLEAADAADTAARLEPPDSGANTSEPSGDDVGSAGSPASILLVEDDPLVRPVMLHTLVRAGYKVEAATTVTNAHERLASRSFDLVVTDGKLPDGSGITIADEAKERGTKVLVVTGHALRCAQDGLGRHDYLLKPVRPAELVSAVRHYVPQPSAE
jgi:CheY-like chemotaxis protein